MKYFVLAFSFLVFVTFSLYFWYFWSTTPVQSGSTEKVSFVIAKNATGISVISDLKSAGLIRSELAAKVFLRLNGQSQDLKPGGYVLTRSQNLEQVFTQLSTGPKDIWLTFPEGWRKEQIAVRLAAALTNFNAYEFINLASSYEGQLFPDTYLVPAQAAPSDVLNLLLKNFSKKASLNPSEPADRQLLILASLIERETNSDPDRKLVAGILRKRLDAGWPLQVDASAQYAASAKACMATSIEDCNWWGIVDTRYPSLYNTYLQPGLPPGPICNPGLASINAAKNPEPSPYWFYLTGTDGVTYYASSLTQHNLNIDKYLRP